MKDDRGFLALLRRPAQPLARAFPAHFLGGALLSVGAVALLAKILQWAFALSNVSIVFLVAVLICALRWGLTASIFAAVLSVLTYDYFFLHPIHTFVVASPQDVLALVIFLAVAVLTSNLTARVRAEADAARTREAHTAALYAFSRALASAAGLERVLQVVVSQVAQIAGASSAVYLPAAERLALMAVDPPGGEPGPEALGPAAWVWQNGEPAGLGCDAYPEAAWLYVPLCAAQKTVGVLAVRFNHLESGASEDERRLLDALAGQAAVTIERATLAQDIAEARVLAETERLRSALLSSISHDLRTPLASITGAATSLVRYRSGYDEATQAELLLTIQEEAERLDRFVGNLLNMTRLGAGALEVNRDWVDIEDVIGAALGRLARQLAPFHMCVEIESPMPLLALDFVLMEQVLVNLLDNAAKYSPAGTQIRLGVHREATSAVVEIADQGIGVPPADLEGIFERFHRVQRVDRQRAGTGLGLSICRGIVEAHGGHIAARLPESGPGTVFRIELPIVAVPAIELEREAAND